MLAEDARLPDDDNEVKLTSEGWDGEDHAAATAYYEQRERERRDLLDWAHYTLRTGDSRCLCRDGWQCLRCRVQALVYPTSMVRDFETNEVPF